MTLERLDFDRSVRAAGDLAYQTVYDYTRGDQPFYKSQLAARPLYLIATEALALIGIAYHTLYIVGMAIPATIQLVVEKIPFGVADRVNRMIPSHVQWGQVYGNHIEPLRDCIWYGAIAPINTVFASSRNLSGWMKEEVFFPQGAPLPPPSTPRPAYVPPTLWQRTKPWVASGIAHCVLPGLCAAYLGAGIYIGREFGRNG